MTKIAQKIQFTTSFPNKFERKFVEAWNIEVDLQSLRDSKRNNNNQRFNSNK